VKAVREVREEKVNGEFAAKHESEAEADALAGRQQEVSGWRRA